MSWYSWEDETLILRVKVQPKASSNAFAEVMGDAIKLRTTAAPVDGKANEQIIAWLAKGFGVAKSNVQLSCGDIARFKTFRIAAPKKLLADIQRP
jgi:uncharacterized protein (TIGR00251 family)